MARPKKAQPNKSEFVRSLPAGTPAKEVVAAATKKGIKLTERYVYVIRSSDNAKARKGKPVGAARGRRSGSGGSEAELRRAIAELGLTASRQILEEVEAAFSR